MPYTPTTWTNGTTPVNATNMNHLETAYTEASLSIEPDMFTAGYVLSGMQATKDGSTANKLNITAGTAYPLQTDATTRQRKVVASSQNTSTPSTTYYLDLNPDGTWSWGTAHSGTANYLTISQVATDGSGNISTVTDKRNLSPAFYPGMTGQGGTLYLPSAIGQQQTQNDQLAGTVIGGVTFGQVGALTAGGDPNGAATFNGTTGYITLPNASIPTGNAVWTLEGICKFSSNPGANAHLVTFGQAATHEMATIYIDTSGVAHAGTFNGDTTGGGALSTNTYHHIVGTWDGTTLKVYVDGAAYGTNATPGNMTIQSNPGATIGARVDATVQFFPGQLDEIAIYTTALSAARVTAHYNAIAAGGYLAAVQADSPLRLYRLGDAVGALFAADTISAVNTALVSAGGGLGATIGSVNGQPTAGNFGVPVSVIAAVDVAVTVNTLQTIATFMTPNDGKHHLVRVNADFRVGSGNTNAGSITLGVHYTDDSGNTGTLAMTNSGSLTAFNTQACNKALSYHALPITLNVAAATTVQINYTNAAAGTISDHVTGLIELLT